MLKDLPEKLQTYHFFGLDLDWRAGAKEAITDCPFCGSESKFSINIKTGQYRCFSCEGDKYGKGNNYKFLEYLIEVSDESTNDYSAITKTKFVSDTTLMAWQVCRSVISNHWLIPAFNEKGKLQNVYKLSRNKKKKEVLFGAPNCKPKLFGVNTHKKKATEVYLCEGPWDAMALYETLKNNRRENDEIIQTSSNTQNLLTNINVVAVPGCNVFDDDWCSLFADKDVFVCYDNDHPKRNPKTNKMLKPAGMVGMRKVSIALSTSETPPNSINVLNWSLLTDGGKKSGSIEKQMTNFDLPSGYDLRDCLFPNGQETTKDERSNQLKKLLAGIVLSPEEWIGESKENEFIKGVDCVPCETFEDLIDAWQNALTWFDGLDVTLSVMLASIASTQTNGDQLWIKVISPASTGKSRLCEALAVAKRYVLAKSTLRGFVSGFSASDGKDHSLIEKVRSKTLVMKDGDTLLQSPNIQQILSEARDVYDGSIRTSYRNQTSKDHTNHRMTWILAGTNSLHSLDSSELGERFLACVIMDDIDSELEDDVLDRVIDDTDKNCSLIVDDSPETQQNPELTKAMQLTGGYVEFLRENVAGLIDDIRIPVKAKKYLKSLARIVSYLRARPSTRQSEKVEREFPARLASQLTRLAKHLALVMNFEEVNSEVMRRVRKVALDTARGKTQNLIRCLSRSKHSGLSVGLLAAKTGLSDNETSFLLKFLKSLDAVERFKVKSKNGKSVRGYRWRLSEQMEDLYKDVMKND